MLENTRQSSFLQFIAGIIVSSVIIQAVFYLVPITIYTKPFLQQELDHIELLAMISYIATGFILIPLVTFVRNKTIELVSMAAFLLSWYGVEYFLDEHLVRVSIIILSVSGFAYFSLTLIKAMSFFKNQTNTALPAFFSCLIVSIILLIPALQWLEKWQLAVTLSVSSILIIGSIVMLLGYTEDRFGSDIKFASIVRSVELPLLSSFVTSYILTAMYWHYGPHAMQNHFVSTYELRSIVVYSLLLWLMPFYFIVNKFNKTYVNLICLCGLIVSFALLPFVGEFRLGNIATIIISDLALYSLWICNILIVYEKLNLNELKIAVIFYFTVSAFGSYTGVVSTNGIIHHYMNSGLLVSVFAATTFLLIYYLVSIIQFRRTK